MRRRSLGDAVQALGWYRQFLGLVLMFAIINIETLCTAVTVTWHLLNTAL